MSQELAGKIAIVTGGASGIGRATVELFHEEGAKVVIADVDTARGEALAKNLGDAARFKRTDVSSVDDVQQLVDFAVAEFGGLHIMFNNAGIGGINANRFIDDELKDFARVVNVNLLGVMLGSQRAARHMAKHGGGSIINTTSISALKAGFGVMTYRATKAGVVHFTKCIAIDFAEYGVRVNCIAPGNIPTDMLSAAPSGMAPEVAERVKTAIREVRMEGQPLKQQGAPRDVANAALYLASDRSALVTGLVLPVDGGITVGDPTNLNKKIMDARAKALSL
jgi:NAD(P)-dependent dehydrogenase (short-subunit alcohol dehydrogenase family)